MLEKVTVPLRRWCTPRDDLWMRLGEWQQLIRDLSEVRRRARAPLAYNELIQRLTTRYVDCSRTLQAQRPTDQPADRRLIPYMEWLYSVVGSSLFTRGNGPTCGQQKCVIKIQEQDGMMYSLSLHCSTVPFSHQSASSMMHACTAWWVEWIAVTRPRKHMTSHWNHLVIIDTS